ncbi:MAG TPA: phosphate regulon sensor histidine kinase PhoR [Burkholderiaceae bacterium]|nr:phosphate regulon sensor histidine kinase PhoR [Burkholderiaceae bacterium]
MIVARNAAILCGLLIAAGLLGWALDARWAAGWLALWLIAGAVYHVLHLERLYRWAALPRQRELPMGHGSWALALDRLNRFMREEAAERADTAAELERVHAAVDLLPDGLIVLDRFNHVQWANQTAQRLHGIFGTGRPVDHFIRQPEFIRYLEEEDFASAVTVALPSQPGRVFKLRVVPTGEQYRLLITRDVTEQSRLDAMRRDFVANVSHEIRTPLTVISGFVDTLLDLDVSEADRRKYLEMVRKQTATMQRLVEDLLTLSSLENATAPPADEPVDVEALLRSLAADGRALSGGRHTITLGFDGPRYVRASASELESAVRNLLTNAIRYTPDGGRIGIEWRMRDGEGWITVRDTGIGIAAEDIPRLTERFYRVDRGRSRETGGTGLGLAIVKHIAQRHHATLEIQSELGKGSAFTLRLPRKRLADAAPAVPDTTAPAA